MHAGQVQRPEVPIEWCVAQLALIYVEEVGIRYVLRLMMVNNKVQRICGNSQRESGKTYLARLQCGFRESHQSISGLNTFWLESLITSGQAVFSTPRLGNEWA